MAMKPEGTADIGSGHNKPVIAGAYVYPRDELSGPRVSGFPDYVKYYPMRAHTG